MDLKTFLLNSKPHNIKNGHPPYDDIGRYDWESKLLYSVVDKLSPSCKILDYGCGKAGTLQHNLHKRFNKSVYYGLDVHSFNTNTENVKLGHIDSLSKILPEVDAVVAGSIFTHLSIEGIEGVLDKMKAFFNNGGEFGFTVIFSDKYELITPNWYGPDTYHVTATTIEQYEDYCNKNNLEFTVLPITYPIDFRFKVQTFCNIKSKL